MEIVREFLMGKRDAVEFMQNYMCSEDLYNYIQSLVPADAFDNPDHEYWHKCIQRGGLACYNFDVRRMLYSHCGFAEQEDDQREIFDTIRAMYLWVNPNQKCTNIYYDRISFFLDLENNCFGGPEVSHMVKDIANEFFPMKPKSARKKAGKAKVNELFHVIDNVKPRWLHGPDWPMGCKSPMAFVTQKKDDNSVNYEFKDVDTGITTIVKQYY